MDEEKIDEIITEVDGRTVLGKKLKELEDNQKKIQETLAEHGKRIDECSIQR